MVNLNPILDMGIVTFITKTRRRFFKAKKRIEDFADWLTRYFDAILLNSIFPAIISTLALASGLMGSLWTNEIKSTIAYDSFRQVSKWPDSVKLFWSVSILTALLFFLRQRADDRKRKNEHALLEKLIRTSPPENFLNDYRDVCKESLEIDRIISEAMPVAYDKDIALRNLREVLQGLAFLAQSFDGNDRKAEYAANIMRFRDISYLDAHLSEKLEVINTLESQELCIDKLSGVLILDPELSTTNAKKRKKGTVLVDKNVEKLILPIPLPHLRNTGDELKRVLPGAAWVYVTGQIRIYPDTLKMEKWFMEQSDFTEHVKSLFFEYFRSKETSIRSFVSIPLFSYEDSNVCIGVLNIHCNKIGLFDRAIGDEPAKNFDAITKPIQGLLSKLLHYHAQGD